MNCELCPRICGADRENGARGYCGQGAVMQIARAALHFGEEPCISGTRGSGTVFFCGCGLGCVYCQNAEISQRGAEGLAVTPEELAARMLYLQNEAGAHNINLVTGAHFVRPVAETLRIAKAEGLAVPVVWNSSGYESVSSLRLLEGLVDVWLPDMKYMDADLAARYSRAADYPDAAKAAVREMVRQAGDPVFDADGMIKRGVIVRHLVLPGGVLNAKKVVRYLHETYGNRILLSLLDQYTPMPHLQAYCEKHPENAVLLRHTRRQEYERVVDYALALGVENAYIQERAAGAAAIPEFDLARKRE